MRRLFLLLICLLLTGSSVVAQSLFPIEVNGRWGYIDVSGKIVVPPKFESGGEFSEGLAAVKLDGKYGYIDATGALAIAPRYSATHAFSEGLARIQIGGDAYGLYGKWGFIDKTGRVVIEPQFRDLNGASEYSYGFHDGLAMIERDYLKGFIDKAGNVVISPRFPIAYSFREGLASVQEGPDRKWGYIDKTGAWVIPPKFDWASLFSEGLGPVSLNGVCGYVDRSGALKLTPKFKHNENDCAAVWGDFNDGLSRWRIGDKFGFINKQGEVVIAPQFDLAFDFSEELAFVQIDGRYGYVDQTGRMVIAPQFSYAKDFQNGLARVSEGPQGWGYINKSGVFVWKSATATADTAVSAFIQPGHTGDVIFTGWSPDGKLLVSYSAADDWIKIWNPHTGQLIWDFRTGVLAPNGQLKSPDGKLLASSLRSNGYEIRDAQSDHIIWSIPDGSSSPERVPSPDGSLIATRVPYIDDAVRLLDSKTNQLVRRLEGHPGIILATIFSPNGKTIATGSSDWTIRLWDAEKGALRKTLIGHTHDVISLAFTRDGNTLVSASEDDTVKVWNVAEGRLLRSINGHSSGSDGINSINLSRDGQTLIGATGKEVRIWDLASGRQLHTLTTNESHTGPGIHGEQMTWCCGSEVRAVALSPNDQLIVSAHEDGTLKLWDAKRARLIRIIKTRFRDFKVVAFSPDGKLIAGAYDESDSTVDLWSVRTGKRVGSLGKDSYYVCSLSFSGDGRMIATGHSFQDLIVWNTKTGKPVRTFDQPYSQYDRVALSPDGRFMVSGGQNQNLLLWNIETGKLVWSVLPIDWEAETRLREAAKKRDAILIAEEAERNRKIRAADLVTATWVRPVVIDFDHYGEPINPLEQRLGEKGELNKSLTRQTAAEAEGVWMRLRNNSSLPISFRTDSFYLPRPGCGVKLSDGSSRPGLCDGMEVSIQYEIEEANRKRVPYGLHVSSVSVLPPGASVLFSVHKSHLSNGRRVFVSFTYLKENGARELEEFGSTRRVQFHAKTPRRR